MYWHPVDPRKIRAYRSMKQRVWHIDTLEGGPLMSQRYGAHIAWHPDGSRFYQKALKADGSTRPRTRWTPTRAARRASSRIAAARNGAMATPRVGT